MYKKIKVWPSKLPIDLTHIHHCLSQSLLYFAGLLVCDSKAWEELSHEIPEFNNILKLEFL